MIELDLNDLDEKRPLAGEFISFKRLNTRVTQ